MKKPVILTYMALALAGSSMLTSCNDDYLDITPTDRVSDAAILSDSILFEAYVTNRYMGVRLTNKEGDSNQPGFGRGFEYGLWASLTDESIYNNDDNTWIIQQGGLSPENLGIAGTFWARSYRSIREINYALANIEQVGMSQSRTNRLIAELRFIRAFRYHDLIRNYGEVVLMGDRVPQLGEDFTDPSFFDRRPIAEAMEYVVSELDAAAAVLPTGAINGYGEGRATKGAALALKARLLLYAASPLYNGGSNDTQKWAQAAAAAKAVMDMGTYQLHPDYAETFITQGSNSEYIFARFYNLGARHYALEIAHGPNGYGGWGGNVPLQNLVDDYEMADGSEFSWNNPAQAAAPYTGRDPRFYATVLYNGAPYRDREVQTFRSYNTTEMPGGLDSPQGPDNWNSSKTGYYLRKFMREDLPIINPWDVAGVQNWIYFRYGEVLLNYAEAQNEAAGPDQTVYDAINAIRERAGMPVLPAGLSQSQMRDRIRHERRIELAFEEHRFYDVRRWMIANDVENQAAEGINILKNADGSLTYTIITALAGKSFQEKHYWLPIPRTEIQASNNQLQQNPNY
ncbi:carbohydrate-binding protein SusD [Flavobacterium akiainvivens]|uniref:Carbohydrate-binding protein SusD n=1 Tax=Flavobacterium akiainvivens TaxID=1202724 RepID=A0A0M8ML22_9FLAO|nr:RagB/SusD family nutrient uptake outer membrane protein [Flavobacterium akiainvivens]KOS08391.1 carbohydrate-binding protein SusD [Flavobacterium akiainvivens]SFQ63981.1 Starch-binding associating with outer membrane [Flavobacterium akiainvivens]